MKVVTRICMERSLGAPVMLPPGKAARIACTTVASCARARKAQTASDWHA